MLSNGARKRQPWVRLLVFTAALAAFLVSYRLGNLHKTPEQSTSVAVLVNPPLDLPPFSLIDRPGKPFTLDDLLDHWTLMLFSPADETASHRGMKRLAGVYNHLASAPQTQARILLVPMLMGEPAPTGDAPDATAPPWRLVTGPAGEVARLQEQIGFVASPPPSGASRNDQGDLLLIIDPKARLYGIYAAELAVDTIANDLEQLADRYTKETAQSDAISR